MTVGCWECYFDLKFHHVRCEHQFIVWRYNFTCALSSLLWTLVWTKFLLPLNNHYEWHHGNVTSKVQPSLSFIFWLEVYLGREGWLAWWSPLCDNVLRSWDVKLCDVTKYTLIFPGLSHHSHRIHWIKTLPQHGGNAMGSPVAQDEKEISEEEMNLPWCYTNSFIPSMTSCWQDQAQHQDPSHSQLHA